MSNGVLDRGAVHATSLVVGEDGVLIRGASGAGKSALAREVVALAGGAGRHAALVCDDRVHLSAASGRLIARAVPAIAGLLEIRSVGIVRVPHQDAAVIRLVVDFAQEEASRLPEDGADRILLGGIELPRITVNGPLAPGMVLWQLEHLRDGSVTVP
jgi:serine kinase of HPr protein (carbohydrate metabolism regulator)